MIKGHAQKRLMSILVVGKKSKQFCFESVEQHKHKNRWPFEVFGRDDCNKWFSCASYNFHSTTIWYQSHKRQRRGQLTFSSSQFVSPDHYGMKINNNITEFSIHVRLYTQKKCVRTFTRGNFVCSNVSLLYEVLLCQDHYYMDNSHTGNFFSNSQNCS